MKKYTLLLITFTVFNSCYTYKTYEPDNDSSSKESAIENSKLTAVRERRTATTAKETFNLESEKEKGSKSDREKTAKNNISSKIDEVKANPTEITVKSIIKEKGYYTLEVFDRDYKIEAKNWVGDTLIAHKKGNPKKEYKFNERDIQNLKVRQFSKGRSDALTVTAYVIAGVTIFLLVK